MAYKSETAELNSGSKPKLLGIHIFTTKAYAIYRKHIPSSNSKCNHCTTDVGVAVGCAPPFRSLVNHGFAQIEAKGLKPVCGALYLNHSGDGREFRSIGRL